MAEVDGDEGPPAKRSKSEHTLTDRILAAACSNPSGLSQDDLMKTVTTGGGAVPLEELVNAINTLLGQGLLMILQGEGNAITFTTVNPELASKFRGLNAEERLIYQLIEEAGVNGIWIRYLKVRSNIQQTRIPRILQTLERRKLIKTAEGGKKRVYMLYDLEPPRKFDFNPEKMAFLTQKCQSFIESKMYATIEDISSFLQNVGPLPGEQASGGKMELTQENVQSIIDTLIYDGKLEDFKAPHEQRGRRAGTVLYKPSKLSVAQLWGSHERMPLGALTEAPCGTCPVFEKCSDEGDITPVTCPYLADWLTF